MQIVDMILSKDDENELNRVFIVMDEEDLADLARHLPPSKRRLMVEKYFDHYLCVGISLIGDCVVKDKLMTIIQTCDVTAPALSRLGEGVWELC